MTGMYLAPLFAFLGRMYRGTYRKVLPLYHTMRAYMWNRRHRNSGRHLHMNIIPVGPLYKITYGVQYQQQWHKPILTVLHDLELGKAQVREWVESCWAASEKARTEDLRGQEMIRQALVDQRTADYGWITTEAPTQSFGRLCFDDDASWSDDVTVTMLKVHA